jgi:hypothetical protein
VLENIWNLCYKQDATRESCRHVAACMSDPRTCGYWSNLEYPLMQETLNCSSETCDNGCQWEDVCEERGVIG